MIVWWPVSLHRSTQSPSWLTLFLYKALVNPASIQIHTWKGSTCVHARKESTMTHRRKCFRLCVKCAFLSSVSTSTNFPSMNFQLSQKTALFWSKLNFKVQVADPISHQVRSQKRDISQNGFLKSLTDTKPSYMMYPELMSIFQPHQKVSINFFWLWNCRPSFL